MTAAISKCYIIVHTRLQKCGRVSPLPVVVGDFLNHIGRFWLRSVRSASKLISKCTQMNYEMNCIPMHRCTEMYRSVLKSTPNDPSTYTRECQSCYYYKRIVFFCFLAVSYVPNPNVNEFAFSIISNKQCCTFSLKSHRPLSF